MTTQAAKSSPPPSPASALERLTPYCPPPRDSSAQLLLDSNEGPPADDRLLDVLRSLPAEAIRRYPSPAALERQLAAAWAVEPERIVVTNGGDGAIDRTCRAVLEPGRDAVIHAPTFEMIERGARLAGAEVRKVCWLDNAFPAAEISDTIDARTGLVALVTPNNPTGSAIPRDDLLAIAKAAADRGALALIDLAYVEFADHDPTPNLLELPNAVVVRTFSKAMGLAGLRVGYAIAPPQIARWLRTTGSPFPVSSVSLAIAAAALESRNQRTDYPQQVAQERDALHALLTSLGARPFQSQANFITARFDDAARLHESLLMRGISVRSFLASPHIADCLRITLPGDRRAFARLTAALSQIIPSEPQP